MKLLQVTIRNIMIKCMVIGRFMRERVIPFNIPPKLGNEINYINDALNNNKLCGDGPFTGRCHAWFKENLHIPSALLTTSCTSALEMCAVLLDLEPGDEVIMPSFTFVSTALAFVMHGAKIVFVDIDPRTMNINPEQIEKAITSRTKAIIPVHYAGVGCDMDKILNISKKFNIPVIEDAAQGMMSTYKGNPLGTIGDMGCYSFHETKNYTCGEGGVLLLKNSKYIERAEILREKGTNRSNFLRGVIDKYTWVDKGSSWLPSELNAAYLLGQLDNADKINDDRLNSWNHYFSSLSILSENGKIDLPYIPEECDHNAHMFYIKAQDIEERTSLISYLKERNVQAVFHYVPLHSSEGGKKYGRFYGEDIYTTSESNRLLRLPMYYGLKKEDIDYVCRCIKEFYK